MFLEGKTILLGVSGGIAAYKSASLASMLVKAGADVRVLMTEHAKKFIHPITFETLTGHKCISDTFDRDFEFQVAHVSLAKLADVVLIAPATADVIAKLSNGLADDMLTTTVLASRAPKLIAPAMNTAMYENPATQRNLRTLKDDGMEIIEPDGGRLACGDTGKGRMPEPEVLLAHVERALALKDMDGLRVLVTAGPTQEAIDPVRYITNHSTGKMGYAIARVCALRGARVTLISGKTALAPPLFTDYVPVTSASDMYEAVTAESGEADIIIKAAAVADYRPLVSAQDKIKKNEAKASLALERTDDILGYLGAHKREGQFLCGFSMETQDMLAHSREKLRKKHLDMIVANNLKTAGAGFGTDTNVVTFLTPDGEQSLPIMKKEEVAVRLMDEILRRR